MKKEHPLMAQHRADKLFTIGVTVCVFTLYFATTQIICILLGV